MSKMRNRALLRSVAWLTLTWLVTGRALAAPEIEFASLEAARVVLGARDAFVERLSRFDRMGRLGVDADVPESQYLAFVAAAARDWTAAERERVAAAFAAIEPALAALLPASDEPFLLIKTTGMEEAGAGAYTRGHAVIVPEPTLRGMLEATLAHEIFHVVSREHPALRRDLYGIIGFDFCGEVVHPSELAPRRITNPDAPVNDYCIRVQVDGAGVWAVPILFSSAPSYDPAAGLAFFDHLRLEMLLVDRSAGPTAARPVLGDDGYALTVPLEHVTGFFEQIGRNTDYVLHPEEILASNFAQLVLGEQDVASPWLLERLRDALRAVSPAETPEAR